MERVTLDHNSLIDVEENRPAAAALRRLIRAGRDDRISLLVVGIDASERRLDHTYPMNFSQFQQKLAAVGLGDAEILRPVAYYGMTFYEWSI